MDFKEKYGIESRTAALLAAVMLALLILEPFVGMYAKLKEFDFLGANGLIGLGATFATIILAKALAILIVRDKGPYDD